MENLALVLVPVLVPIALLARWAWLRGTAQPDPDVPRHQYVSTRASSADGALVRVQAEVTYRVEGTATGADELVCDAAEEALRRAVVTRRVLALPGAGDEVAVPGPLPEGLRVERMVVVSADVEVTRELRRLVGGP